MSGSNRGYIVAIIAAAVLALGIGFGWASQPEQPRLTGNAGAQPIQYEYYPGGPDCQPTEINKLPRPARAIKSESCQEAAEQHRLASNDLIQQRRSADAADAMAVLAYQQTWISAWGLALGFITMAAAIAAAFYARSASVHSESSYKAFVESERAVLEVFEGGTSCSDARESTNLALRIRNMGGSPCKVTGVKIWPVNDLGDKTGGEIWIIAYAAIPPGEAKFVMTGHAMAISKHTKRFAGVIDYVSLGTKFIRHFNVCYRYNLDNGYVGPHFEVWIPNLMGHPDDT